EPQRMAASVTSKIKSVRARPDSGPNQMGPTCEEIGQWIQEPCSPQDFQLRAGSAALMEFSLRAVYSRDLVGAHRDGLIHLTGLASPLARAAYVRPSVSAGLTSFDLAATIRSLEAAQRVASAFVVLDAPEYALIANGVDQAGVASFAQTLALLCRAMRLPLVINVNCRS